MHPNQTPAHADGDRPRTNPSRAFFATRPGESSAAGDTREAKLSAVTAVDEGTLEVEVPAGRSECQHRWYRPCLVG